MKLKLTVSIIQFRSRDLSSIMLEIEGVDKLSSAKLTLLYPSTGSVDELGGEINSYLTSQPLSSNSKLLYFFYSISKNLTILKNEHAHIKFSQQHIILIMEMELAFRVQFWDEAVCFSIPVNTLWKGINVYVHPFTMGK